MVDVCTGVIRQLDTRRVDVAQKAVKIPVEFRQDWGLAQQSLVAFRIENRWEHTWTVPFSEKKLKTAITIR